jgi:type IV pilus assembly protein PilQ
MNLRSTLYIFIGLLLIGQMEAQVRDEYLLKRADRGKQGVNPDELVSFAPDLPYTEAVKALSEMSKRFTGKIVVDTDPLVNQKIGVAIQAMHWKDAMEIILKANNRWYVESDEYFQILPMSQVTSVGGQRVGVGAQPGAPGVMGVDSSEFYARNREVLISTIFLEVQRSKLNETGVNFTIFKSGTDGNILVEFAGADLLSPEAVELFNISGETTPGKFVADLTGAIRIFEETGIGNVLAKPQITVQSGSAGRVQLGEDFSVKQRTISGDVTETFFSTGTIMEVTPKVFHYKGIDFVSLILRIERSTLIDPVNVRVAKTTTSSKKVLFDGEEDYLGGLFITSERTTRAGIPLLKDIPVIKYLFSYEKVEQDVRELVVIIRAELVPMLEDRVASKDAIPTNLLEEKLKENRQYMDRTMPDD